MKHIYDAALRVIEAAEAVQAPYSRDWQRVRTGVIDKGRGWFICNHEVPGKPDLAALELICAEHNAAPVLLALLREQVKHWYSLWYAYASVGQSSPYRLMAVEEMRRAARAIAEAYPQHSGELRKALEAQHD